MYIRFELINFVNDNPSPQIPDQISASRIVFNLYIIISLKVSFKTLNFETFFVHIVHIYIETYV